MMRLIESTASPPERTPSRRGIPLGRRSITQTSAARACVSALVPSRSRTVDRSTTGSTGFWRNASAPRAAEMSPAASGEIATTSALDRVSRSISAPPRPARQHQLDDRQLRREQGEPALGLRGVRDDLHSVTLRSQEVVQVARGVGIALGDQDEDPDRLRGVGGLHRSPRPALREQPVGVARRQPVPDLLRDEHQLLELASAVPALTAGAAGRDHEAVAVLPGAQRRHRNVGHAGDRADAVQPRLRHRSSISRAADA